MSIDATLLTLLSLVALAGSGFYFIGRLAARVDRHEVDISAHAAATDRIYDKIDELRHELRSECLALRKAVNGGKE